MSTAQGIAAVLGAIVPLLVALASLLWWAYRRGEAAGMEKAAGKAKIEALEHLLTETRAELASLQPRRRRSLAEQSELPRSPTTPRRASTRPSSDTWQPGAPLGRFDSRQECAVRKAEDILIQKLRNLL